MSTSSIEIIRETAANQRRRRNVAAMHTVANAVGPAPRCAQCTAVLTPEERLLHAIFGTCDPARATRVMAEWSEPEVRS